jgi:branched-chain amino acid aminotransferase
MSDSRFAAGAAFIEGRIVPIDEGRIPIVDVGFSRSDVTYDVVAVWEGAFFRLADHLDRFERSCATLRLQLTYTREEIEDVLKQLVRVAGLRDSYVEVICTRGVPPAGVRDPRQFQNRFYAFAVPYIWILGPEEAGRGMDAVITRTVQRIPDTSIDPTVKNFHWGDLTRGLYEAYDRGSKYPILLDGSQTVTEGAGYNIFVVVDGALLTPERGVLHGVTRRTVLELAERHGIAATSADISAEMLRSADEVFATSTAGGVMPVTSIDGAAVGDGKVGVMTDLLRSAYWQAHNDPAYRTPVDYDDEEPRALLGATRTATEFSDVPTQGGQS